MTYHWLCRTTEGERLVQLWLIEKDNAAEHAVAYGCVPRAVADRIREASNFPWEEDSQARLSLADEPRNHPCEQPDLFSGVLS